MADSKTKEQDRSLENSLLKFEDELTVFSDNCSFLCDAFTGLGLADPATLWPL
jgi:hypothetical protein